MNDSPFYIKKCNDTVFNVLKYIRVHTNLLNLKQNAPRYHFFSVHKSISNDNACNLLSI